MHTTTFGGLAVFNTNMLALCQPLPPVARKSMTLGTHLRKGNKVCGHISFESKWGPTGEYPEGKLGRILGRFFGEEILGRIFWWIFCWILFCCSPCGLLAKKKNPRKNPPKNPHQNPHAQKSAWKSAPKNPHRKIHTEKSAPKKCKFSSLNFVKEFRRFLG